MLYLILPSQYATAVGIILVVACLTIQYFNSAQIVPEDAAEPIVRRVVSYDVEHRRYERHFITSNPHSDGLPRLGELHPGDVGARVVSIISRPNEDEAGMFFFDVEYMTR